MNCIESSIISKFDQQVLRLSKVSILSFCFSPFFLTSKYKLILPFCFLVSVESLHRPKLPEVCVQRNRVSIRRLL